VRLIKPGRTRARVGTAAAAAGGGGGGGGDDGLINDDDERVHDREEGRSSNGAIRLRDLMSARPYVITTQNRENALPVLLLGSL
jgi:hypothetical protein